MPVIARAEACGGEVAEVGEGEGRLGHVCWAEREEVMWWWRVDGSVRNRGRDFGIGMRSWR